jgi:hypothetical protein
MSRVSVVVSLLILLRGAEAQEYRNDFPADIQPSPTFSAPLAAVVKQNPANLPKLLHDLQSLGATYEIRDFDAFANTLRDEGLAAHRNRWPDQTEDITIVLTPVAQIYGVAHLIELQLTTRPEQKGHTSYPIARVFPRITAQLWLKGSAYPKGSFLRKVQELVSKRPEVRRYSVVNEVKLTYSAHRSRWTPQEAWIYSAGVILVESDEVPARTQTITFYGVSGYSEGVYEACEPFKPIGRPLRGDVRYLSLPAAARDARGGKIWADQ